MPYLATVLREQRKARPNALVVDAGGWASGTPLSDRFQGTPMIEIMNELGYHAAGVGSPDLAFGLDALRRRASEARFPLLSANLVRPDGSPVEGVVAQTVCTVGDVRVGLVGLTDGPSTLAPAEALLASLYTLRAAETDVVVVLSHLGLEADRALARAVPGIECVIVGVHGDPPAQAPERYGDALLASCGGRGASVGTLRLSLAQPTTEFRDLSQR